MTWLFNNAQLSELTLLRRDNQLSFVGAGLSSSVFEAKDGQVAVLIANSSIYVGNRSEAEVSIMDITPPRRSERAANLGIAISS